MLGEIKNIRSEMDQMKLVYERKIEKLKTSNFTSNPQLNKQKSNSKSGELSIVTKLQDLLQK